VTATPTPTDVLKDYSHRLQLAAPKEWEAFVRCFEAYSETVTAAVIDADPNEILHMQGKAKAFRHLLWTFRTCHVTPRQNPASSAVSP